ncbi:MAG TPA: hypothetical protein ENK71_02075 [Epsilonproteobacteria bacterium]|nr:hypothetical protein [Campylobacterota bacterium]
MPESQGSKLKAMMRSIAQTVDLEVCLVPYGIKKKSIEKIKEGDILMLPSSHPEVVVLDEDQQVLAQGFYGFHHGIPSVLLQNRDKDLVNSKKYESFKISLGTIRSVAFDQEDIVSLQQNDRYNATLYHKGELLAYANFVQVEQKVALQIEEVK